MQISFYRTGLKILAAALILLVAQAVAPAYAVDEEKDGWRFTAFAGPYGRFKATTIFDTIMVDNGVFRFSIQGPDFDTFKVFNPENKSYIKTSVVQYAQQWAPSIRYEKLRKISTTKFLNLNCDRFVGDSYQTGTSIDGLYTNEVRVDKNLSRALCILCGLPSGYGLPVRVLARSKHGPPARMFELLKLEKTKSTVQALLVPKSYRFVQDQALFFLADEDGSNSGADDLFSSIPMKKKNNK